jgi:hypothetical protein
MNYNFLYHSLQVVFVILYFVLCGFAGHYISKFTIWLFEQNTKVMSSWFAFILSVTVAVTLLFMSICLSNIWLLHVIK